MSNQSEERRGSPRFAVVMDAEATDLLARSTVKLRCSDISLSGCYLDTLNPMGPATPLRVRLIHGQHTFEAQAQVAYTAPRLGMGVAFAQPVPPEQLAVLNAWLSEAGAGSGNAHPPLLGAGASG